MPRASARVAGRASRRSRTTASPVTSSLTGSASRARRSVLQSSLPRGRRRVRRRTPAEWDRLDALVRRRGRLTGARGRRAGRRSTSARRRHLSVVRSARARPGVLVGRLSTLVARARLGGHRRRTPGLARAWPGSSRCRFPAALYRARWWLGIGGARSLAVWRSALGWWVAAHPQVQATIATRREVDQLVEHDFADYYRRTPPAAFAAQVVDEQRLGGGAVLALGRARRAGRLHPWQNAAERRRRSAG